MRKRSLAEAFQASLAEDDAKAPRRASPPDEDETGADYMSDALLEQLEARAVPRPATYSERREKARRDEAEARRAAMDAAEDRQRARRGEGSLGESEARQRGLATNVIDRVAEAERARGPAPGAGSSAALRMMMAMGYEPGKAIGNSDSARTTPLAPDQRWMQGKDAAHRVGIGHASLSKRIAHAAQHASEPLDPQDQAERFRHERMRAARERHVEALLRKARRTCRELDEEAGFTYSPLWLDPSCFPQEHALYQPRILGENERGDDDAVRLLLYALKDEPLVVADVIGANEAAPEAPSDADATAEARHEADTDPQQRRTDARRFCTLAVRATHCTDTADGALGAYVRATAGRIRILSVLRPPVRVGRGA